MLISATAICSPARERIDTFAIIVPASRRINEKVAARANLGLTRPTDDGNGHALFRYAQGEFTSTPELALIGGVTAPIAALPAAWLRWVGDRGRIDNDLLAPYDIN